MANSPQLSQSKSGSPNSRGRNLRYLILWLGLVTLFWSGALFLIKRGSKVFISQWSVIFLTKQIQSRLDVPGIGSASAQVESPFDKDADIKQSYKIIATTDEVRKAAAAKLGMSGGQFGKPQVEVVDGTAFMNFQISGNTKEEAQRKAYALHEAFEDRLNQLRTKQAAEQEQGFERSLSVAREKLEKAQYRLSEYKLRSGLVSGDQVTQLAINIEGLRRLRAEIMAQQQEADARAQKLSRDLNITPQIVNDAFALRTDPLFQQYSSQYSESSALLAATAAKFGPNHPLVQREAARREATRSELLSRAQVVVGHPVDEVVLARLSLSAGSAGSAREDLFKTFVTTDSDQRGFTARAQEIERQMAELQQRLTVLAQRGATLEGLTRDTQIAEAIFTSTLTSLDASKSDLFGAYPPIQLVAAPSAPSAPIAPNSTLVLIGAASGTALVSLGLFTLWVRKTTPVRNFLRQRTAPSAI